MARTKGIQCCESCGRDCRGRYCRECIGHAYGQHAAQAASTNESAEDDYSEDSNADSVYRGRHDQWEDTQ